MPWCSTAPSSSRGCFTPAYPIPIEVPLSAQIIAFALSGGGAPGYHFHPGPPGRYSVVFQAEGRFRLLIGGRVRGDEVFDVLQLWIEAAPGSEVLT